MQGKKSKRWEPYHIYMYDVRIKGLHNKVDGVAGM